MDAKNHWEEVYQTKSVDEVSWFQVCPSQSLDLIQKYAPDTSKRVLDAGGGASNLVDHLLDLGYSRITVLDIAESAIKATQERLSERSALVDWVVGDVLSVALPVSPFDIWHDRAVFHFLTDDVHRNLYFDRVRQHLAVGGYLVLATFGPDGPTRCSGLPVQRYSVSELVSIIGPGLKLVESFESDHATPDNRMQAFLFSVFVRI